MCGTLWYTHCSFHNEIFFSFLLLLFLPFVFFGGLQGWREAKWDGGARCKIHNQQNWVFFVFVFLMERNIPNQTPLLKHQRKLLGQQANTCSITLQTSWEIADVVGFGPEAQHPPCYCFQIPLHFSVLLFLLMKYAIPFYYPESLSTSRTSQKH